MTERRYTVAEINRMRSIISNRWGAGGGQLVSGSFGAPYDPSEKIMAVEAVLQTYMLAGISPEDLENDPAPIARPGGS